MRIACIAACAIFRVFMELATPGKTSLEVGAIQPAAPYPGLTNRDDLPKAARLFQPLRIPDNFPQMVVRILKVTRITAPECIVRSLDDSGPRRERFGHDCIDFSF